MKVNFKKDILLEALGVSMSCVSTKNTIAATEGILINCENDNAVLVSYDLEKGIRTEIEADVIEPGSCVINAQSIISIIRVMPGATVTLEVGENLRAKVYSGKSEFEINALSARDYPTLPDISNTKGFTIKQGDIKGMISQSIFAVAQNDSRQTLNGLLIKIEGGRITTVGCDGFRIAIREKVCDLDGSSDPDMNASFIVPGRTMTEVLKLLEAPEEKVSLSVSLKQVIFRFSNKNTVFFSRLIEGEYIDYEKIIPKNSSIFVDIDKASLEGAISRASLVTDESAGKNKSAARCHFYNNKLEISSSSVNGTARDEIPTNHVGDEIEIGFNCRYLSDAIKATQCDMLHLSLSSPLISVIIEPHDIDENDKSIYLVLPIKLPK